MPKGNGKPIPRVLIKKSVQNKAEFIAQLKVRFESNMHRHKNTSWSDVDSKLDDSKLESVHAMETTGGEPDAVIINEELCYVDCSQQTPERRHICYDQEGEAKRKKKGVFPGGNAVDLANEMGIELLTIKEYRSLQDYGEFDTKTSSWLATTKKVRDLGGAFFGDRRYDTVFVYHNGADSFYGDRGFRGLLRL